MTSTELSNEIAAARKVALQATRLPGELAAIAKAQKARAYQHGHDAGYWNKPDLWLEGKGTPDWMRGWADGQAMRSEHQDAGIF